MGAAAARFRRERVLIVGCGDVGLRVVQRLPPGLCVLALTSNADKLPGLRAMGVKPLLGNLDDRRSLLRLPALGTRLIHLAPPPATGAGDPRTRALSQILLQQHALQSFVYGSTSGVYGDCLGEIASENKAVKKAKWNEKKK